MKDAYIHGEVLLHTIKELPEWAKKLSTKGDYHIVAPSEITGNHHVIDVHDGVEFYEKDGILYLKNDVPTDIRCVVKERHDNITLDPGIWEIDRQKEFDYLTMEKRNVAD